MKTYLSAFYIEKLLLYSTHDIYPVYDYCKRENITLFIDLNPSHTGHFTDNNHLTIDQDGFLFVKCAYICIKMGMRLLNTEQNNDVQKPTENRDASMNIFAPLRNMTEQYIFLLQIIQGYLACHQGTLKHGKICLEELP